MAKVSASTLLIGLLVFFAWLQPVHSGQQILKPEEFLQIAEKAQGEKAFSGEPLVVFIPGILGSKLTNEAGQVIWGDRAVPVLSSLVLPQEASTAEAEVLDAYPLKVTRLDVYGRFETEMAAALGGTKVQEFAYDWRQDLDVSTEFLDRRLREDWKDLVQGRRLIIVSHSMGGLIAWNWKNRFYPKGGYDFKLHQIVVVGSPLEGSCEMLRMLLLGYRPYPGASMLEDSVYKFVFNDLRPAAFTFPSIFQVLPDVPDDLYGNRDACCLVVETEAGTTGLNHFSRDAWERFLLPYLEGERWQLLRPWTILFRRPAIWDDLRLTKQEFFARLEQLLVNARKFRKGLDLAESPLDSKVTYFYSNSHDTTAQMKLRHKGVASVLVDTKNRPGDGRVLEESATLHLKVGLTPRHLVSAHGALIKDVSFITYLRDFLRHERIKSVAFALESDPSAMESLVKFGGILPLSDVGIEVWNPRQLDEGAKALVKINLKTLEESGRLRPVAPETLGNEAYALARVLDDKRGDKEGALPIYETALASGALEEDADRIYALNRYGYSLVLEDRGKEAVGPLEIAAKEAEKNPGLFPMPFRARIYNNLGLAYEQAGNGEEALMAYQKASDLGSEKGLSNFKRVKAGKLF